MNIGMKVTGAKQYRSWLLTKSATTKLVVAGVVRTYGNILLARVKARASGRPGPNAPTGDYRRSINLDLSGGNAGPLSAGEATATVGTNAVQGRRLEYGFVGADSLGRVYNQSPYPHFGPALDEVGPLFLAAVSAAITADLGA